MKRLGCMLLALLLAVVMMPSVRAEESVVLRLQGAAGKVGDSVTVAIRVENAPECVSFDFKVAYDPRVLAFEGGKIGEDLSYDGWHINGDGVYDGKTVVSADSYISGGTKEDPAVLFSGNATLLTMTFKIIGETSGDFGSKLEFQQTFLGDANAQGGGKVTPGAVIEDRVFVGDDLGRELSTAHAVRIMQKLIGLEVEVDTEILERTGDENLSIADAVAVLRALNGT